MSQNKNIEQLAKRVDRLNRNIAKYSYSKFLIIGALLLVVAVTFAVVQRQQDIRNTQAEVEKIVFHESFTGAPSSPVRFEDLISDWDVQYHVRNHGEWEAPPTMEGHHGPNCEAPLETHTITQWPDAVFQCANHVMTTANGNPGYGLIYLTPPAMVDWSDGEAVVRFDVSSFSTVSRDWISVWITPWEDNMVRPFDDGSVDLHGSPDNALEVSMNQERALCITEYRGFERVSPGNSWGTDTTCDFWQGLPDEVTSKGDEQRARDRETVEIRISDGDVSVSMPEYDYTFHEYTPQGGGLVFDQGIVQLGHHSYTPSKDADDDGINSWHWDEVHIEPAVPFTIIRSGTEILKNEEGTVTFDAPAPANSHLRFAGVGDIEVSVDGAPYESAQKQDFESRIAEGYAQPYWHPLPEGAQQVSFRMSGGYGGSNNMVRDFAIFSRTVDSTGGSNPTPTDEPVEPTNTPVPPTATNVPAATNTPAPPTPTDTPVGGSDPTPTSQVSAQSALSLSPVSSNYTVGQSFTSEVRVNTNGQTVNAVDAQLSYPTDLLEVVSTNSNGGDFEIEAERNASNGNITLAYGTSTPKSGNLLVATITFRAKAAGTANVNFTADSAVASSVSNTNVLNTSTNGNYTLVAPTPTPTNTPTPIPVQGDMNGDRVVDVQDLSYILSNWRTSDEIADVNDDGIVEIRDLSIMLSNWTQ